MNGWPQAVILELVGVQVLVELLHKVVAAV
jgi:hypothetical protein